MKNLFIILMFLGIVTMAHAQRNEENKNTSMNPATATLDGNKEAVPLSKLPKDAVNYIKENYPVTKIREISKIKNSGNNVMYEVKVNIEGKIAVVQFDKKGELINELTK